MNRYWHFSFVLMLLLLLGGCASKYPYVADERDSLEGFNRQSLHISESIDYFTLRPVSSTYANFVPDFVRQRVSHFYANLDDVPNAINHTLQGEARKAGSDFLRLLINTTIGILGLFDVSTHWGLPKSDQDFGITLAKWGVPSGSYFVIPLFGPSTLRDAVASLVDYALNPLAYVDSSSTQLALLLVRSVDRRADFLTQEEIVRSWTPDFYVGLRNYYLSKRHAQTSRGNETLHEEVYLDFDESKSGEAKQVSSAE